MKGFLYLVTSALMYMKFFYTWMGKGRASIVGYWF